MVVALASAPRPTGRSYSSVEVCRLVRGVTYRQLDYWTRQGVLRPAVLGAAGPGSQRRWSAHDLVAIAAVARLRDLGGGTRVMTSLAAACHQLDLESLPRVAAVDAVGVVGFGPGLVLEELGDTWLVLIEDPAA